MLEIFKFYIKIVSDLFGVMSEWVLSPGVNYLNFCLSGIFTIFFISLFYKRYRKSHYDSDTKNKKE